MRSMLTTSPVQQSKEDKQGNTKKRQVELESCGNSERRVGGGSPV